MARRKSVLTEDAKKSLAKVRATARREAAEAQQREAQSEQNRLAAAQDLALTAETTQRRSAAVHAIKAQAQAVAASWGVRPRFSVQAQNLDTVRAYTDWKSVVVQFPLSQLPVWNASIGEWESASNLNTRRQPKKLGQRDLFLGLTGLLGAIYHEVGHIRFTIPFPKLALGAEHRRAWNILEDQRMERAVVADSQVISTYLTKLVIENLTDYVLVIGRDYLPADFRQELRAVAVQQHGAERVADLEGIVWDYIEATTQEGMEDAVRRLHTWQQEQTAATGWVPPSVTNHTSTPNSAEVGPSASPADSATSKDAPKVLSDDTEDDDTEDAGDDDTEDALDQDDQGAGDSAGDDSGQGGSDGPQEGEGAEAQSGEGSGSGDYRQRVQDAVQRAVEDLDEDLLSNEALTDQLQNLVEEMSDTSKASVFPEAATSAELSPEAVSEADRQINAMIQALEVCLSEGAPHWTEREREGVLNPLAYRTRQPGDREFYRAWTGDEDPGANIVVSLVLDCSESMHPSLEALSQAAWVTGQACKRLGVTYRAFGFGSRGAAGLIYEYSRDTRVDTLDFPRQLEELGGTEPLLALQWVSTLDTEGKQHLVIVLTDGYFQDADHRRPTHVPSVIGHDATLLGIGYHPYSKDMADAHAQRLARVHGIRHTVAANSLQEIPRQVENFLRSTLSR